MKYENGKAPLVCMMTQSTCYRQTSRMKIKGVLWHSTGANNPWIKRYVQPDDNAPDRDKLLAIIGKNVYGNDWNHSNRDAGVNAFVGKLEDGSVSSVQVLPWDYKPWGCGGGCNNGWIQFEICEDSLLDSAYFQSVYKEACELTAYLCRQFGIDPYGKVGSVPTILCHQDSYQYGMGSNHADVYHWFNRYGKTMDDVRRDVKALLDGSAPAPKPDEPKYPNCDSCFPELPVLGLGDCNGFVYCLQRQLIAMGYDCGGKKLLGKESPDGKFGQKTKEALAKLQSANLIKPDGLCGKDTWPVILNF